MGYFTGSHTSNVSYWNDTKRHLSYNVLNFKWYFFWELIALTNHSSRRYSRLALITQKSRLKQCRNNKLVQMRIWTIHLCIQKPKSYPCDQYEEYFRRLFFNLLACWPRDNCCLGYSYEPLRHPLIWIANVSPIIISNITCWNSNNGYF